MGASPQPLANITHALFLTCCIVHEIFVYAGGDPGRPERPSQEKLRSEAALMAGIVDLSREQQSSGAEVASILRRHGLHVHQVR